MMDSLDDIINAYFCDGFEYSEILAFLERDGYDISLSTLQRRLRSLGLKRRNIVTDHDLLQEKVSNLHTDSGSYLGKY